MAKSKRKSKLQVPLKNRELPATIGHVEEVHQSLRSDIAALELRMSARFDKMDAKAEEMLSKYSHLEVKVLGVAQSS